MKRIPGLLLGIVTACVTGCAAQGGGHSGGLSIPPLPESARVGPEHYVVVAVHNEPSPPLASRAGSTLRGYDGAASYAVSDSARKLSREIATDYRLDEVSAWPIAALRVHCIVYRVLDTESRDTVLARLATDPRIELAQPLNAFATSTEAPAEVSYNDPYIGLQHGLRDMSVVAAHHWSRGDGATVAVVDTGADRKHPDLAGRIRSARNFVDRDDAQFDRDRHGTEVAGVIAAVGNNGQGIVGVAPQVHILALKACWQGDPAGTAGGAVCNSFTLALALGAALAANVDVINLSLVGPADPLLTALTRKAIEQGTIVVGAVPPNGRMDGFPADVPGVIAVDMAEQAQPAKGALLAPGRDVLTLTPAGHYDFASGSSLATANVAGIVALMRSRQPRMTAGAAASLLARSMQALGTPGGSRVESINACMALSALLMRGDCPAGEPAWAAATTRSAARDRWTVVDRGPHQK